MKCYGAGFFATTPVLNNVGNTVNCTFVLGCKEKIKKNDVLTEITRYYNFICWAEAAELINKVARKGMEIYYEAVPRDEEKNGKYVFRLTDFQLLTKKYEKNIVSE